MEEVEVEVRIILRRAGRGFLRRNLGVSGEGLRGRTEEVEPNMVSSPGLSEENIKCCMCDKMSRSTDAVAVGVGVGCRCIKNVKLISITEKQLSVRLCRLACSSRRCAG